MNAKSTLSSMIYIYILTLGCEQVAEQTAAQKLTAAIKHLDSALLEYNNLRYSSIQKLLYR